MCFIFNLSLGLPNSIDFKKARVTPIYKGKGCKTDCSRPNYRPISVICHVAKMFEKCVQKQLLAYVNIHDFITPDQSAFLKDHSTVTALHKITDNWLNNIEEGLITVVCYFDITKCFDVINHDILLFKLMKYGIRGSALMWFESYLKDRMQATLLHNNLSTFLPVDCGVLQGSLLGPVLFLLFINDLLKYVFNCNLYADDTTIDRCGKSLTEVVGLPLIQGDADKLLNRFVITN